LKNIPNKADLPLPGIDKVYVLSVKSFADRIEHIQQELSKNNISFDFVFDFDIVDITDEDLAIFSHSNMEMPHKSLVLKNIAVWKRMVKDNVSRALVLEDDAILNHDFRANIHKIITAADALAPGYLIFLGGADTKLPKDFLESPETLIPRRMTTADGFIIDNTLAKKRLQWLKNNSINLPADGLMCKIDEDIGALHYWPKQAIVQQASCTGQFKTTLDGSRSKHSLFYIGLRYRWHKFKNQSIKRWLKNISL